MTVNASLEARAIFQTQGQDPRGPVLFENISFKWDAPGLHVIMGGSGSGKSSLLKSIGGVWQAARGRVLINGQDLWRRAEPNPDALRNIGFAFQNNALFSSLKVAENIAFPHRQRFPEVSERDRQALALEWLTRVGLEHVAGAFPHELSGGMQKRLSIARTLVLKPDFIFLDDPTAGLDPITSKTMADLVASLLEGSQSLVVIVTNDPDRARDWGPNIHFLTERRLLSRGAPEYAAMEDAYL